MAQLSKKQKRDWKVFKEMVLGTGEVFEFDLIGGSGSGKTAFSLLILHLLCSNYSGVRFAVVRKSEVTLKRATIPSFQEAIRELTGANPKDIPISNMIAKYPNGSEILFQWADASKDPTHSNLRGLELTGALIEEVNQVDKLCFDHLKTRIRYNTGFTSMETGKKVNINPFIMTTCNPSNFWGKAYIYDRWVDGTLPPETYVSESVPLDNPKFQANPSYIKMLESLPETEKQRFLHNNWEVSDNPAILIGLGVYKQRVFPKKVDAELKGEIIGGLDVSDEGSDNSVLALFKGNTLFELIEFEKMNQNDLALKVMKIMESYDMAKENSIIIDSTGLGVGTANRMIEAGWKPAKFKGGSKAQSKGKNNITFKNKRAESYWLFKECLEEESIELFKHDELVTEMTNIEYNSDDKQIILEPKKRIKTRIGRSPDFADAVTMANYLRLGYCKKKPRKITAWTC